MDRNGDGRLSRTEFRGPPSAFGRMDRNNDGYIARHEAAGTRLTGGVQRTSRDKSRSATGEPTELIHVDTHNHLVGRRVRGKFNFERQARIALDAMDATGVKLNLLMPMPQAVNQEQLAMLARRNARPAQ